MRPVSSPVLQPPLMAGEVGVEPTCSGFKAQRLYQFVYSPLVALVGFEPTTPKGKGFKSSVYTSSTIGRDRFDYVLATIDIITNPCYLKSMTFNALAAHQNGFTPAPECGTMVVSVLGSSVRYKTS